MEGFTGVWDPSAQAELEQSVKCALTTLKDISGCFIKEEDFHLMWGRLKIQSELTFKPVISLIIPLSVG